MKKVILFVLLLFTTVSVYASELSLECPKEVKVNDKIDCSIKVSSLDEIEEIKFTVSTPSDGTLVPTWSHVESGGVHTFTKESSTSLTIGSISFTAKEKGTATVKLDGVTGVDNNTVSKSITVIDLKSDNANLASLTVNGNSVPGFNKDKTEYKMTVNTNKINIEAKGEDAKAQINVPGSQNLSLGEQTFNITVTSESGKDKTYKLVITYEAPKDTDNSLKSLELYNGTSKIPELDYRSDVYTYEGIKVKTDVSKLTIKATINNSKAKFVTDYGPRDVELDYGENIIHVRVEAESGDVADYTIKVNREDGRSSDATLSKLVVNGNNVELKEKVYEYDVNVRYNETKSRIEATATNNSSTVDYEDIELVSGLNDAITITVTSENNKTQEYKIHIFRLSEDESKITLQKIEVVNYDINFSLDKKDYDINLRDGDDKLKFVVLPTEGIKVNELNNENLSNNSTVILRVTDDDGTKTYTFNIIKPDDSSPNKLLCYGIFFLGLISATASVVYTLTKKKKVNDSNDSKEVKQEEKEIKEKKEVK